MYVIFYINGRPEKRFKLTYFLPNVIEQNGYYIMVLDEEPYKYMINF